MRAENTLRRRLLAAYVLLAVIVGGVFAAAAYVIVESLEHEMIEMRLSRAADVLMQGDRAGSPTPPILDLRIASAQELRGDFRELAPGLHEIETGDRTLQVLIVAQDGRRHAVIDDVTDFERLERISFWALGIAFIAGVLLAVAIARASASRIIAPLIVLADAVQKGDATVQPQLLNAADEVGFLARAFQARTSQLAEFLDRERFFTADVSHELRTPLTVILGAAELLSARLADRPELLAVAERIRRTAAETAVRVSALLQLARSPEQIESPVLLLNEVVRAEIERSRMLLEGKPVEIAFVEPAGEVRVRANAELAAIAVGNLLRNACHFTRRGMVRVTLDTGALVVEDTGPGVPQALRGRLFEPFVRDSEDASSGSGLGLFIVKRVAGHLGWRVALDEVSEGGSRFTLSFGPPVESQSTIPHFA